MEPLPDEIPDELEPLDFPNYPDAPLMRRRHAALVSERLDHLSFYILAAILSFDRPTQAQVARFLALRYWTVRNHVDCSPWVIKLRLDRIRLSVTPEALAMMLRIKDEFKQPSRFGAEDARRRSEIYQQERMKFPAPPPTATDPPAARPARPRATPAADPPRG